jgi:hypothetical protein
VARIFLSYASEDRDRARSLAADLEALGWTVWWDRKLQAGKTFAGVIESEIKKADCVLVLWSKASIVSRWVRDEANEGLERGVLVPVLIDAVAPPMGFRSIHAANLVEYEGDHESSGFRQLVADLSALLATAPQPSSAPGPVAPEPERTVIDWGKRARRFGPAVLGVAALGIGAYAITQYFGGADRRAGELEARQKAFDEARRRDDEEAAKRQADLEAKERGIAEKARAAEADAARRAEEEEKRRIAQAEAAHAAREEKRRVAQAEADRVRAAEAARSAEEGRRLAQKAPPKPIPPTVPPAPQAAIAPPPPPATPAAETAKPPMAEPPESKTPVAARAPSMPAPGDTWTYRYVDGFRRAEVARLTYRVDTASERGVGESLRVSNRPDYQSRIVVAREPRFAGHAGLDYAPPDLAPYLQAFYRLEGGAPLPAVKRQLSSDAEVDMPMRIAGREQVTVPAGTFDAIKVVAEGRGSTFINRFPVHSIVTVWYAPEVKRFVKFDARSFERNVPQEIATFELVEYKVAR